MSDIMSDIMSATPRSTTRSTKTRAKKVPVWVLKCDWDLMTNSILVQMVLEPALDPEMEPVLPDQAQVFHKGQAVFTLELDLLGWSRWPYSQNLCFCIPEFGCDQTTEVLLLKDNAVIARQVVNITDIALPLPIQSPTVDSTPEQPLIVPLSAQIWTFDQNDFDQNPLWSPHAGRLVLQNVPVLENWKDAPFLEPSWENKLDTSPWTLQGLAKIKWSKMKVGGNSNIIANSARLKGATNAKSGQCYLWSSIFEAQSWLSFGTFLKAKNLSTGSPFFRWVLEQYVGTKLIQTATLDTSYPITSNNEWERVGLLQPLLNETTHVRVGIEVGPLEIGMDLDIQMVGTVALASPLCVWPNLWPIKEPDIWEMTLPTQNGQLDLRWYPILPTQNLPTVFKFNGDLITKPFLLQLKGGQYWLDGRATGFYCNLLKVDQVVSQFDDLDLTLDGTALILSTNSVVAIKFGKTSKISPQIGTIACVFSSGAGTLDRYWIWDEQRWVSTDHPFSIQIILMDHIVRFGVPPLRDMWSGQLNRDLAEKSTQLKMAANSIRLEYVSWQAAISNKTGVL